MSTAIIGNGIGSGRVKIETVATLPETGLSNRVYLVPIQNPTGDNKFIEYIWVNEHWERIGGVDIDLSGYLTKTGAANTYYRKDKIRILTQAEYDATVKIADVLYFIKE